VNFGVFISQKNDTAGYTKSGNGFTIWPMRWAGTIVAVLLIVKRESYRKAPLIVSPVGRPSEWDGGLIKSAVRSGVEPAFSPSGHRPLIHTRFGLAIPQCDQDSALFLVRIA